MAAIAAKPFMLGASTVKIGTTNYESALSGVSLDPSSVKELWRGVDGSSIPVVGSESWEAKLTFAQDVSAATALSRYLYANVGTSVAMEFVPVAGGQAIAATVAVEAASFGGDFGKIATATVTLSVVGRPTFPTGA